MAQGTHSIQIPESQIPISTPEFYLFLLIHPICVTLPKSKPTTHQSSTGTNVIGQRHRKSNEKLQMQIMLHRNEGTPELQKEKML